MLKHTLVGGLLGFVVAIPFGCNDDVASSCYPRSNFSNRPDGAATYEIGICRWNGGGDYAHLNTGPSLKRDYGEDVFQRFIVVCEDVEEGQECNGCDAERMDALLHERYSELCDGDPQVVEFMRGCYTPRPSVSTPEGIMLTGPTERCCYTGVFWSKCEKACEILENGNEQCY